MMNVVFAQVTEYIFIKLTKSNIIFTIALFFIIEVP